MVAIGGEADLNIDFVKLHAGIKEKLPSYARPYFVRIVTETDMTGKMSIRSFDVFVNIVKIIFLKQMVSQLLNRLYFYRDLQIEEKESAKGRIQPKRY